MGKDPRKTAGKAQRMFGLGQYKKAGRIFSGTGRLYMRLHDFKLAIDNFQDAAQCYLEEENYFQVVDSFRQAADACLNMDEFSAAYTFFKTAIKQVSRIKGVGERNFAYVLYSALSHLCLFVHGKQDQQ